MNCACVDGCPIPFVSGTDCRYKANVEQVELLDDSGSVVTVSFFDFMRYLCSGEGDSVRIVNTGTCPDTDCPLFIGAQNIPDGINIIINPVNITPPCEFLEAASFARLGSMNAYIINTNVLSQSGQYDVMIFKANNLIRTVSNAQQGESVPLPELQGEEKRVAFLYVNDPSEALSIFFD